MSAAQSPEVGKSSVNEQLCPAGWGLSDEGIKAYTARLDPSKWGGRPYSARYIDPGPGNASSIGFVRLIGVGSRKPQHQMRVW